MQKVTVTLQAKGKPATPEQAEFFKIYSRIAGRVKKIKTKETTQKLIECVEAMKALEKSMDDMKSDG